MWIVACVFLFGKPREDISTNACDFYEHFCIIENYSHVYILLVK